MHSLRQRAIWDGEVPGTPPEAPPHGAEKIVLESLPSPLTPVAPGNARTRGDWRRVLLAVTIFIREEQKGRRLAEGAATSSKRLPPTGEQPALRCAQAAKNQQIIDAGNLQSPAWISVLRNNLQEIICRVDCLPGVLADWRFLLAAVLRLGKQLGAGGSSLASGDPHSLQGATECTA